ncbi:MAG: membrane-bound lytic murein transglycosylase MltF [Marinobacter sp.]
MLALLAFTLVLSACSRPTTLQQIKAEGVMHVITRVAPSIYYKGRDGPTGYDYELVQLFAEYLDVELRIRVAENNTEILSVLAQDFAHIGMAGLSGQKQFQGQMRALATGIEVESVVVYHRDSAKPEALADLADKPLHIVADSNHEPQLEEARIDVPQLSWQVHPDLDAAGLLARVESGELPYAVVLSNELALNHVFFPDVKEAIRLGQARELAWLFPAMQDRSLIDAARQFFGMIAEDGTLEQITERFYGHLDRLNYVGALTFVRHTEKRLPKYESLFRSYADQYAMDWRLLAAIGYQESHWRPKATSPTGVRGLMMLTRATAKYVGVKNRLSAEQSIRGGAKYLTIVHDQIPDRIEEPDRTWFALASYNVGFGHLEDARILTEKAGRNPDRWLDVKEFLPLLTQKEWYSQTKYGYARGHEPVIYVQNIRRYYDVLVRMTEPAAPPDTLLADDPLTRPGTDDEALMAAPEIQAALPAQLTDVPPTL